MDFKQAANFVMPFGKYRGRALDKIAEDDAGLEYLDWLRGVRAAEHKASDIDQALRAYLADPAIAADLAKLKPEPAEPEGELEDEGDFDGEAG